MDVVQALAEAVEPRVHLLPDVFKIHLDLFPHNRVGMRRVVLSHCEPRWQEDVRANLVLLQDRNRVRLPLLVLLSLQMQPEQTLYLLALTLHHHPLILHLPLEHGDLGAKTFELGLSSPTAASVTVALESQSDLSALFVKASATRRLTLLVGCRSMAGLALGRKREEVMLVAIDM
jgi:hypothetical protein